MQTHNEASAVVNNSTAVEALSPKQELARQLSTTAGNGDGGFLAQLAGNPFFTAGFGLAGLGFAATFAQRGIKTGAALLRRRLLVDVEINVKDVSYPWFLYWMTLHERGQLPARSAAVLAAAGSTEKPGILESLFRRFTPRMRHLAIETEKVELPNGAIHTNFVLIPGPGKHIIRYKNAWIWVNRVRETKQYSADGKPWETVTLTTLYAHRHIFETLFKEAHDIAAESVEGKTVIYQDRLTEWTKFGNPRRKRPLESVVLDEGVKEKIVEDVQDFLKSAAWYADRGIPYRRGYLLYGPPGTGKSSFIQALAGHLDYDIAILNLSQRGLTDDRLSHLLTIIPSRTLVLLEDVDAAFANRRQTDSDGYQGANVTFSGLLNALDGVASAEERIIFLTTNHVDRLDEALVRPGRVDMTVRLGEATTYQISKLWERFYGPQDTDGKLEQEFMKKLHEANVLAMDGTSKTSTAALQGLFLYNKDNPKGAIEMAWQLSPSEATPSVAPTLERSSNA